MRVADCKWDSITVFAVLDVSRATTHHVLVHKLGRLTEYGNAVQFATRTVVSLLTSLAYTRFLRARRGCLDFFGCREYKLGG